MVKSQEGVVKYKSFGDSYGRKQFYQHLPKLPIEDVLNVRYLIKEARIVEGFATKFGKSDFCLLLLENESGVESTTLCGGRVVMEKIRNAQGDNALPLYGTIIKVISEDGNEYYDIK